LLHGARCIVAGCPLHCCMVPVVLLHGARCMLWCALHDACCMLHVAPPRSVGRRAGTAPRAAKSGSAA
jgi:hypothetical protein